jgi:maleylpyruvate isomerase
MKFFDCNRSSAAYRVRIALALKGLAPDRVAIDIHGEKAAHLKPDYVAVNPQKLVPALVDDEGRVITQSLAIVEYLDEVAPAVPLLPAAPADRALARSIALAIACDIHPFGTPRVARFLAQDLGLDGTRTAGWARHWIRSGLEAVEDLIRRRRSGPFAAGPTPTIADIVLVPQVLVAERNQIDLGDLEALSAVVAHCRTLPAFVETAPGFQPVPA